jgi:hypothetical protein
MELKLRIGTKEEKDIRERERKKNPSMGKASVSSWYVNRSWQKIHMVAGRRDAELPRQEVQNLEPPEGS